MRELLADALWSAQRGGELTHRLLAFARRQPLDPRVTDVNALICGMTGLVRRTLDSRIEMRESPAGPVADPDRSVAGGGAHESHRQFARCHA